MTILFFIIFPIATILISIVLQRLLKNPLLVAILIFAIFLILAYTVFSPEFLLNAIIYAIIAFITAAIIRLICCLRRRIHCNFLNICDDCDTCSDSNNSNDNDNNGNNLGRNIERLENSIDSLEDNINNLNCILSRVINNGNNNCGCNNSSNNNCCCNRRLRR